MRINQLINVSDVNKEITLHVAEPFMKKYGYLKQVRNFPLLPCCQNMPVGSYLEPVESNPPALIILP
jgi:hypothetical protein